MSFGFISDQISLESIFRAELLITTCNILNTRQYESILMADTDPLTLSAGRETDYAGKGYIKKHESWPSNQAWFSRSFVIFPTSHSSKSTSVLFLSTLHSSGPRNVITRRSGPAPCPHKVDWPGVTLVCPCSIYVPKSSLPGRKTRISPLVVPARPAFVPPFRSLVEIT